MNLIARPDEVMHIQSWLCHGAITLGVKVLLTNKPPFSSYTTLYHHSDSRRNFPAYMISRIPYSYIKSMCIECVLSTLQRFCASG